MMTIERSYSVTCDFLSRSSGCWVKQANFGLVLPGSNDERIDCKIQHDGTDKLYINLNGVKMKKMVG